MEHASPSLGRGSTVGLEIGERGNGRRRGRRSVETCISCRRSASPSNCQQVDVTDVSSHECTWKSTTRRAWVFKQISQICQHWAFCPIRSWYQVLVWCIGGMKRVSADSATPFLPHSPARQFPAQLRGCGPRLPQPKSKGRGPGNEVESFSPKSFIEQKWVFYRVSALKFVCC